MKYVYSKRTLLCTAVIRAGAVPFLHCNMVLADEKWKKDKGDITYIEIKISIYCMIILRKFTIRMIIFWSSPL
jgi:hypothetical protein